MKVNIERVNDAVQLKATNDEGNFIMMDGSPEIGGTGNGARPMQVLLMSLGGCSSMDVLSILKKMRENVEDYKVEINGERREGEVPAVFTKIHVHYILKGKLNENNVNKAINLSMEKYCSVTKMLEPTVEITHSFEIVA
jgi:putative redox protein